MIRVVHIVRMREWLTLAQSADRGAARVPAACACWRNVHRTLECGTVGRYGIAYSFVQLDDAGGMLGEGQV